MDVGDLCGISWPNSRNRSPAAIASRNDKARPVTPSSRPARTANAVDSSSIWFCRTSMPSEEVQGGKKSGGGVERVAKKL